MCYFCEIKNLFIKYVFYIFKKVFVNINIVYVYGKVKM